jgi:hypothetical protein
MQKSGKRNFGGFNSTLKGNITEKMLLLISLILSELFKSAFDSQSLIQLKMNIVTKVNV